MIVKAQATCEVLVVRIGRGFVNVRMRYGDEPWVDKVLFENDTYNVTCKIDIDTGDQQKWDHFEVKK